MKTVPSWRRHHYAAIFGIFLIMLIALALIAGMVGCGGVEYDLTITSTAGGLVTTPGEGTHTYDEGTMVNLVAEPEEGYHFERWTGDVSAIESANAITTTISMNDDYQITVYFEADFMVATGRYHMVGLKDDGTVVTVGWNKYGKCDVGNWTNITQVSTCWLHTVGLKDDGTVVAVGWNDDGQCDVAWTGIA